MDNYELLDFGEGRRLERFGTKIIDRPCPAAENRHKTSPQLWLKANYRFITEAHRSNSERGRWLPETPSPWIVDFGAMRLELRGTPFGHLGVFPEQRQNWPWIAEQIKDAQRPERRPIRVLNLFAYTGGSSIAAALAGLESAGVETVHVDSSRNAIDWAKRNAELSGVAQRIRFIGEDARKFVQREIRRGNRYDAVMLDPPSYGHGVRGEAWKIAEHLPELLAQLATILSEQPVLFLLTAHSPGLDSLGLQNLLRDAGFPRESQKISMMLSSTQGQSLPSGCGVFWGQEHWQSQRR